jgi:hypothetical protein
MRTNKGNYMEEHAAESRSNGKLRRVLMRDWKNGTVRNRSRYSFKAIAAQPFSTQLFDDL